MVGTASREKSRDNKKLEHAICFHQIAPRSRDSALPGLIP